MAKKIGINQCILTPNCNYYDLGQNGESVFSDEYRAYQKLVHFFYDFGYWDSNNSYVLDIKSNNNDIMLFTIDFDEMYSLHPELINYIKMTLDSETLSMVKELIL